jgi:Lipoprotein LpqB beta-propeller domain
VVRARLRSARPPKIAVLLAVAAAAASGCAAVPATGQPQVVKPQNGQAQAYALPLPPPPPTASWKPKEVVLGFLHASATYALDPSAARAYLAPSLAAHWNPSNGVTVVGGQTSEELVPFVPNVLRYGQGASQTFAEVKYTGQRLATLGQFGQYLYGPKPGGTSYEFTLEKLNGVWLITRLSNPNVLLLTQSDFEQLYQPRNLFFFTRKWLPPSGELVPDPVYAPVEVSDSALNTSLATGLVDGLLQDKGSWLTGATQTAFPAGTTLIGQVTISGEVALVNLGGAAAHATQLQVNNMAAQLQSTLGDDAYSTSVATSVQLEINGRPQYIANTSIGNLIPPVDTAAVGTQEPYFVTIDPNVVSEVQPNSSGQAFSYGQVIGPGQVGTSTITAVASAGQQIAAVATAAGGGCAVDLANLSSSAQKSASYRSYRLSATGGPCTSLSWAANGDVWAVAGSRIWLLPPGGPPQAVSLPNTTVAGLPAIQQVYALRMAPDAVRAALLVRTAVGNQVMLAAVSYNNGAKGASLGHAVGVGSGLSDPTAISWYDPYHLVVLASGAVYNLPLTGAAGQRLNSVPTGAESLTSDGSILVIGTNRGQIWTSPDGSTRWTYVTNGANPIYAG